MLLQRSASKCVLQRSFLHAACVGNRSRRGTALSSVELISWTRVADSAQSAVARSVSTERPVATHAVQPNEECVTHEEPSTINESQAQQTRCREQVRLRGQQQRRGGILSGAPFIFSFLPPPRREIVARERYQSTFSKL